jgi:drug/metabolite transporter (DMT)-like permease
MIGALATTLLFACNAIFANRSAKRLGSNVANLARLTVAVVLLGAWAHWGGQGLRGASFPWFFVSGLVGFGLGGVAMFQALPRLGSALSMLIVQCGSAVIAATVEWGWLGTRLTPMQLALIAVTLVGVALGLMPRSLPAVPAGVLRAGVAWAFLSAGGQGFGAVLSRKAFRVAALAGESPDPATTAYQRALAGLCVAGLVVLVVRLLRRRCPATPAAPAPRAMVGRAWPWVLANALCGPVLGVTCFQWALSTTPAGIVQPIVATAPLLTIPLAWWLEHLRPRPLYYLGTLIAVAGVAGLFVFRA